MNRKWIKPDHHGMLCEVFIFLAGCLLVCQSLKACLCEKAVIETEVQLRLAVETGLSRSIAVFAGKVVEISTKCNEGTKIIVSRSWKGEFPNNVALVAVVECMSDDVAIGDSCQKGFQLGKEYLVFADQGIDNRLRVNKCSLTDFYEKSDRIIGMLDQLMADKRKRPNNKVDAFPK